MKSNTLLPALIAFALALTFQHPAEAQTKPAVAKKDPSPAELTAAAQREALKRYPDLGKPGSQFNQAFNLRREQYKREKPDFFKDPTWPLKLANRIPVGLASIPVPLRARFGPGREAAMKKYGGTPASEQAVVKGLDWLQKNQNKDGSWGRSSQVGMTGLALLCFLGHGETPDSVQYGPTITKAVQWFLDNGTNFGDRIEEESRGFLVLRPLNALPPITTYQGFGNGGKYQHAIGTCALGEYYAITKDERVLEVYEKAVRYIVQGQTGLVAAETGLACWNFGAHHGSYWTSEVAKETQNLCTTGWQVQALIAAHLTRLDLPGVDQALDKAMAFVESVKGPKGGYGYQSASDNFNLTGIGITSLLLWRKCDFRELRKGFLWMDDVCSSYPEWAWARYATEFCKLESCYYQTQARRFFSDGGWYRWNYRCLSELVNAQAGDGSWPEMKHWKDQHSPTSEPVYRTAICVLMLEAFYRFDLPPLIPAHAWEKPGMGVRGM